MLFDRTLTTESMVASICRRACISDSSSCTETSASGLPICLQTVSVWGSMLLSIADLQLLLTVIHKACGNSMLQVGGLSRSYCVRLVAVCWIAGSCWAAAGLKADSAGDKVITRLSPRASSRWRMCSPHPADSEFSSDSERRASQGTQIVLAAPCRSPCRLDCDFRSSLSSGEPLLA